MATKKFSFRAFTSLTLFWMFVALLISGCVLFIAPPGRVAHWTDWQLLALTKERWQSVHTLTALAFLIGGLFHLLKFNRHVIWTYVKRSRQAVAPFRGVLAASTVVSALVVVGAVADWPPFSLVMSLGETWTQSWENAETRAPSPHAEELPLSAIVNSLDLDAETAETVLGEAGIQVNGLGHTVREVADAHDKTPFEVYSLLQDVAPADAQNRGKGAAAHAGFGRKTVADAAGELGIGIDEALQRLQEAGLDAVPGDRLRTIAARAGVSPAGVYDLLAHGDAPEAMMPRQHEERSTVESPRGGGRRKSGGGS